ncbi:putative transporting ATPase [Vibrio astriarenae]|nr:putative transporting ATPase [Vibrio sp. C7]
MSAGFPFNVSCDNLHGDIEPDRLGFMTKVHQEVMSILDSGIPPRVAALSDALRAFITRQHLPLSNLLLNNKD